MIKGIIKLKDEAEELELRVFNPKSRQTEFMTGKQFMDKYGVKE